MLDLFCKAGGASMGYHQAGFDVIGVDIEPQENYPFKFIQADALSLDPAQIGSRFHAVHASPPCQVHSKTSSLNPSNPKGHEDLLLQTRSLLRKAGRPYVIENVPGAPLIEPVLLCGSSFGLRVRRHRLFETSFPVRPRGCEHRWQNAHRPYVLYATRYRGKPYPGKRRRSGTIGVYAGETMKEARFYASVAMGIDWMSWTELAQAVPPAYTRYIGSHL